MSLGRLPMPPVGGGGMNPVLKAWSLNQLPQHHLGT